MDDSQPDVGTAQAVTDALAGAPGSVDQTDSPVLSQLTPPDQAPPQQPMQMQPGQSPQQLPPRQPGTSVASQPQQSKADFFRNMLGDFFYSAGKGLASRGSGPDADARGAGAALTALSDRRVEQQQLENQRIAAQGNANFKGAQAEALANNSQMVDVPSIGADGKPEMDANGQPVTIQMPAKAAAAYRQAIAGKGITAAAATANTQTKAQSNEDIAAGKEASAEKIAAGKPSKSMTDNDLYALANKGDKEAIAILKAKNSDKEKLVAARNSTRAVEVTTRDNDGTLVTKYMPASQAMTEGLSSATQGTKNASKQAQIGDIETGSQALRKSISALGTEKLPATVVARLQVAMQSDEPSIIKEQFKAIANEQLTPAQQDFVIALNQQNERALSLRGIAGQGQGATDTRNAIRDILPGAATGDIKYMLKKMDAFDQQVSVLKSGIAKPGGSSKSNGALSLSEAQGYLQKAGGDANKARALARKDGRSF